MEFVKWIILIVSFALTGSTPSKEFPSRDPNFTNEFNKRIAVVLKTYQPDWNGSYIPSDEDKIQKFQEKSNDEMLLNVTTEFLFLKRSPMTIEFPFPSKEGNSLKMSGQFLSLFVEGYLRDSNRHILTEKLTLNFSIRSTVWDDIIVEYIHFDPNEIKLVASDHQFESNEEIQIKKALKAHIRATINQYMTEEYTMWNFFRRSTLTIFYNLWHNDHERYYFIDTIPSKKYTLTNVTINGLWNARSISTNVSNLNAFPIIEMSGVRGSMIQDYANSSNELSFKVDEISISMNQNTAKVNVKAKRYSVVNVKLNSTLEQNLTESIIGNIESAIADSLQSVLKSAEKSDYYEPRRCQFVHYSNEQLYTELNCTGKLNNEVAAILQKSKHGSKEENRQKIFAEKSINGKLYNCTLEFSFGLLKIEVPHNDSDIFRVSFTVVSLVLDGYLTGSNHHIVTEGLTSNESLSFTKWEEFSFKEPISDENELKILSGDYQYKPNEESEIKKEIETQINIMSTPMPWKNMSRVELTTTKCELLKMVYHLSHNDQECYYFIGTIQSANYSLNNVTINGLWNIKSISADIFSSKPFVEIEMGHVRGFMARNLVSTSEELSFKADNIYISRDGNIDKTEVRMKEYSVVNAKLNTTLTDDESKVIIEEIQSAFAASLKNGSKNRFAENLERYT